MKTVIQSIWDNNFVQDPPSTSLNTANSDSIAREWHLDVARSVKDMKMCLIILQLANSIHLQNIPSDTDNDETRQEESNMTDLLNEEEINIMRFQDHEQTSSFSRVDWSVRTNDERNTSPETETWRYVR